MFNYVYKGTVIDEVTKLPVEGASVYIGAAMFCETLHEPNLISQPEKTKSDGSFKIRVSKEDIEDSDVAGCPVIWASKESYKGSIKENIPASSGKDGISIELYHNAQLRLHVKRDAVKDNVDEVEIWISRYDFLNNMKPIEYRFVCRGKTYDSILTITNMWSNMSYGFEAGAVGRRQSPIEKRYYSFRKSLVPDLISDIDLSFGFDSSKPTEITQIFNPDLNNESVSDIDGNICPSGWHVPTMAEWGILESFLVSNGYETNGNTIAKSLSAPSGWIPSTVAGSPGNDQENNNKSGFSVLPGESEVHMDHLVECIVAQYFGLIGKLVKGRREFL